MNLAWGSCPGWYWVMRGGGFAFSTGMVMCVVLHGTPLFCPHRVFYILVVRSVCAGMAGPGQQPGVLHTYRRAGVGCYNQRQLSCCSSCRRVGVVWPGPHMMLWLCHMPLLACISARSILQQGRAGGDTGNGCFRPFVEDCAHDSSTASLRYVGRGM